VTKTNRKRRYRRGYPVAVLVGFEADHAVLWRIFSRVAKLYLQVELAGKRTDEKALYNFHEQVVEALKPVLKEHPMPQLFWNMPENITGIWFNQRAQTVQTSLS
jgi:hypothetical protein